MDPRITHAIAQMHARLAGRLTVAGLAREVNLSASRFTHLFQHEIGTAPVRYLHALRMTHARLLLERTFLSVKEVMGHVGFNDPSHFSRDFRRFHGASPRQCRAADGHRQLEDGSDVLESASVSRIAALANDRRKAPTKRTPGIVPEALPLARRER